MILAGFIFGLDHDDEGVFEKTSGSVKRTGLSFPHSSSSLLFRDSSVSKDGNRRKAPAQDWAKYNGATVVFKPKLMTEETLQRGLTGFAKRDIPGGPSLGGLSIPAEVRHAVVSNLAIEKSHRRRRRAHAGLSRILQRMNDTIHLQNTRDLIQRMGAKIAEKKLLIGQRQPTRSNSILCIMKG